MKSDLTPAMRWQDIAGAQVEEQLGGVALKWREFMQGVSTKDDAREALKQAREALEAMPPSHERALKNLCRAEIARLLELADYSEQERRGGR